MASLASKVRSSEKMGRPWVWPIRMLSRSTLILMPSTSAESLDKDLELSKTSRKWLKRHSRSLTMALSMRVTRNFSAPSETTYSTYWSTLTIHSLSSSLTISARTKSQLRRTIHSTSTRCRISSLKPSGSRQRLSIREPSKRQMMPLKSSINWATPTGPTQSPSSQSSHSSLTWGISAFLSNSARSTSFTVRSTGALSKSQTSKTRQRKFRTKNSMLQCNYFIRYCT